MVCCEAQKWLTVNVECCEWVIISLARLARGLLVVSRYLLAESVEELAS
jgi:hypothetical protein